ncbi:MAG: hypothetical protein ACTSYS_17065 [Promethearchaeota archaeon]
MARDIDWKELSRELILPTIMMAFLGIFYWAIRGTGGYGGSSGGTFAGLGWATCWYFLSRSKNDEQVRVYGSRWSFLAITFGISMGGLHGYGQFISWIAGRFMLDSGNIIPVNPAWGWLALFQCGLTWGGMAGIFLGWTRLGHKSTVKKWIRRILFGAGGGLLGLLIYYAIPWLTLPLYAEGIYGDLVTCAHCVRTLSTAESSSVLFGIFAGLLADEIYQKNWENVKLILLLGAGFGAFFMIGALWFFGPAFTDVPLSWWKNWEMSIGFGGGLSFGIIHYLFNKKIDVSSKNINDIKSKDKTYKMRGDVIVGVNFTISFSLMWIVYNGLNGSGLYDNFFAGDQVASKAILIITLFTWTGLLAIFFISIHTEKSKLILEKFTGTRWKDPALKFVVIQSILSVIGMVISIFPVMSFTQVVLVVVYIIAISTGIGSFLGLYYLERMVSGKQLQRKIASIKK